MQIPKPGRSAITPPASQPANSTQPSPSPSPVRLQSVKGMRDFYPPEMRLRQWLFDTWRQTAKSFGMEEYDACVLEHEALYLRKAGEEIAEQLYRFEDKSQRSLALRPEMTPSLARMVLQRKNALSFPLKWFSIPQCFRYERMSRGRRREHFQWNADIIGTADLWADAEIVCLLLSAMQRLGLSAKGVQLRLNSRGLMGAALQKAGVTEQALVPVLVIMDKRDKLKANDFTQQLVNQGLSTAQVDGVLALMDARSLSDVANLVPQEAALRELDALLDAIKHAGFGEWVMFDPGIVRGLAYYTGVVFEGRDTKGEFRALCGGGRYDGLLSTLGGPPTPAVGFGFGDAVIMEMLQVLHLLPNQVHQVDDVVIPHSHEAGQAAMRVAMQLRAEGKSVFVDFSFRRLKRSLTKAVERGFGRAILLMPDELARGEVVVRNLITQQETTLPLKQLK